MITLSRPDTIFSLSEIQGSVREQLGRLPEMTAPIGTPARILRYEWRCEPVSILAWLHNQTSDVKLYWSGRDGSFEMGGVGIADQKKGTGPVDYAAVISSLKEGLSLEAPRLRYYGGMAFDPARLDETWSDFGSYHFIVPRFELTRFGEDVVFAVNIAPKDLSSSRGHAIASELDHLDFSSFTEYRTPPRQMGRLDLPDRDQWRKIFADVTECGPGLKCDKIVLARKSIFDFDVLIRPSALLKHLKDLSPECFHFCFQQNPYLAFLGASPERLFKRSGTEVQTEAIAGTRPRGASECVDAALENQLICSEKDAREHRYVTDAISLSLEPLCRSLTQDKNCHLKKLNGTQHLVTRFDGILCEGVTDARILTALHPTPAVGGHPTERAVHVLRKCEPFSRGWYAGPVGCVGLDETEFAVAIRSGLVRQNQLALFAGAGIVEGSTADDEWDEMENKIGNFIKVFCVGH